SKNVKLNDDSPEDAEG
ncbi:hypothetical protein pipiens_000226, partial [Culex pipiens pipiens]